MQMLLEENGNYFSVKSFIIAMNSTISYLPFLRQKKKEGNLFTVFLFKAPHYDLQSHSTFKVISGLIFYI